MIATTGFHCRTFQRLAPPNVSRSAWNGCAWKSASTGTSRVLMQISLQSSSGFNPSRERHMKSSSQAGMKRTWKKTGISLETCHCSFQWRTALNKKTKSGLSLEILPAASAQVSRRSWDKQNNHIKLEQCLILYWVCSPI